MEELVRDTAYACIGSCRAAVTQPIRCGDKRCTHVGEPLKDVSVVYSCLRGHCPNSTTPSLHTEDCPLDGGMIAKAVVPRNLQVPTLDPPEENRSYSSVWDNDAIGTGHARSMISTSPQGWSAGVNDEHQWVVMDAGQVVNSIGGILLTIRKDGFNDQLVTKVAVDVATMIHDSQDDDTNWTEVPLKSPETNLTAQDCDSTIAVTFTRPVTAQYVRIRPLEWERHISLRCAILLAGDASDEFVKTTGDDEYRTVIDVRQLPANVPLTCIPGGSNNSVLLENAAAHPMGVIDIPTGRCEWAGRRMNWNVLEFNDQRVADGTNQRVFASNPGTRCSIRVAFQTRWDYNPDDYCPGCIVQLYYGMDKVFSEGVVRHGIRNYRGESRAEFVAPATPGLYYITQAISLQYHFVSVRHGNEPDWSLAAVRVLPASFDESTFSLLPRYLQHRVLMLLAFQRRSGEEANVFGTLSRDSLFMIVSFLMNLEVEERPF